MRRCSPRLQWIAGGFVLLAACSGSSADESEVSSIPVVTTAPNDVAAAPLQSQILEDDEVSIAEMEHALRAVATCVDEQGYMAELRSFDGGDGYGFSVASPTGASRAAVDALQIFEARFLPEIEDPFRIQHGPTPEEIEADHELMRQCLREKGYQMDDSWPIVDTNVDIWDVAACDPDLIIRRSSPGDRPGTTREATASNPA